MRIFLVGFMGAGKTTVGERLAARLGSPFLDLDQAVETAAGKSVKELFEESGEPRFRELEAQELRRLSAQDPLVVATGGGTLTHPANRDLIRKLGVTFWLHPDFAILARRIGGLGKQDRPLFRDETQALALYRERLDLYRRADRILEIEADESPEEVAARIELLLPQGTCAT